MKNTQYIGIAVNKLRKSSKMTLKELSDATGLSQGFLSKFERGQTTIAVDSLLQIAEALGTSLDKLLEQQEEGNKSRTPKVVHRSYENSVLYTESSFINYQITNSFQGMDVFPKITVLLPTRQDGKDAFISHGGQEFVYVLEGILTLQVGEESYDLYPGDTAHFKSDIQHNWYNSTNKCTKILTINTPNVFSDGSVSEKLADKDIIH